MSDKNDNYIDRVRFAVVKLGTDALQEVPIIGEPLAKSIDTMCHKMAWAGDYINKTTGGTGGPGCEGVQASINEEGSLTPGETPAVKSQKTTHHLD
jgi:hypothetical protein